jgi:hypothetical protein
MNFSIWRMCWFILLQGSSNSERIHRGPKPKRTGSRRWYGRCPSVSRDQRQGSCKLSGALTIHDDYEVVKWKIVEKLVNGAMSALEREVSVKNASNAVSGEAMHCLAFILSWMTKGFV